MLLLSFGSNADQAVKRRPRGAPPGFRICLNFLSYESISLQACSQFWQFKHNTWESSNCDSVQYSSQISVRTHLDCPGAWMSCGHGSSGLAPIFLSCLGKPNGCWKLPFFGSIPTIGSRWARSLFIFLISWQYQIR